MYKDKIFNRYIHIHMKNKYACNIKKLAIDPLKLIVIQSMKNQKRMDLGIAEKQNI